MSQVDQVASQMVVLPTGVVILGGLLFLILGLTLLSAGLRTWVKWRRLVRERGADAVTDRMEPRPHEREGEREKAA
jgi:hypothetical protein